jgi:uncharacterized membrane protein
MPHTPTTAQVTGPSSNVAGALSYVLGPITGVLFYVLQKDDPFVRFHAMQSIIVSVAYIATAIGLSILGSVLLFVPVIGWIVGGLLSAVLSLGGFILWVVLIVRAFQGREWQAPFVGQLVRRQVSA